MMNDYQRIAKAINYLSQHIGQQPTLDQVAAHVHLSAFHFQRLFCQWAGVSPKRFLQVMTLEKAKQRIRDDHSLLETATELGLSSSSRLYDHFVALEAVTPGEFKSGGANINIEYGLHSTPFGELLLAQTQRGICWAAFIDDAGTDAEIQQLKTQWPKAEIVCNPAATAELAQSVPALLRGEKPEKPLALHIKGSNFQVAVWRALLRTAPGDTLSYSDIAHHIGKPDSVRAVANAIGANQVALLIPCHRVIRKSGALGGYRWGDQRKQVIRFYEHLTQSA